MEKISQHLKEYSVHQTMGVGRSLADKLSWSSLLEYEVKDTDERDRVIVQEKEAHHPWVLYFKNSYQRGARELELNVMNMDYEIIVSIKKPKFRMYLFSSIKHNYKATLYDARRQPIGMIKRMRGSYFRGVYQLRVKNSRFTFSADIHKLSSKCLVYNSRKKVVAKITARTLSIGEHVTCRRTFDVRCFLDSPGERCSILALYLLISCDLELG